MADIHYFPPFSARSDLHSSNLRGHLPPAGYQSLGRLTRLRELSLDNNHLTGRVPDDLRWSQYNKGGGCQLTCSECSHGEHTNHFDCPLPSDSYKCINWNGHSGAQCG